MIAVDKREQIRQAYFNENKTIRQIARELHCGRHTVDKALQSAEPGAYTLSTPRPAPVLGPHKALIDQRLAENERLPRKQRYTAHKIFKDLQAAGYVGSESTVRGYVTYRRRGNLRHQQGR